jgi:carbamoyl-phosphate synthase large subunit
MATVLTTAAGGDIGIGAIQSLQERSHETVAVDMDPNAAGLYLADEGYSVPPATSDEWPAAIARIVDECDVNVIIPLLDQELRELDDLQAELDNETPVIVPRTELIERTIDKREMYDYFEQKGLRVPETSILDPAAADDQSIYDFDAPKIIKPRHGQGGNGVKLVCSADDLGEYLESSVQDTQDLLLQEYIDGPEYTSNVTVTADNRLLSIVNKEVPKRDGYTALGITRDNPTVKKACRDAFEALEPAGPMNVQHMLDEDGTPHLIEINPRFSGSSCLTVKAGVNEFDLLVRDALGDHVDAVTEYETGLCIIRYTDQLYIDETSLLS